MGGVNGEPRRGRAGRAPRAHATRPPSKTTPGGEGGGGGAAGGPWRWGGGGPPGERGRGLASKRSPCGDGGGQGRSNGDDAQAVAVGEGHGLVQVEEDGLAGLDGQDLAAGPVQGLD